MKTILLTGATGFLGSYLLEKLVNTNQYNLITLSRNKEVLLSKYSNFDISHFDMEEFHENLIPFEKVDIVVHLAFSRANKGEVEISKSLMFSNQIISKVGSFKIPQFINISTQEVYGKCYSIPWKESFEPAPQTIYGMAKFASELFTRLIEKNEITKITNLRLPGLISKETDERMVNKFVRNVIEGKPIQIIGGTQLFSQLDVRDAADGIIALLKVPPKRWKPVYNLGYTKSYNIVEIAESVARVAKEFNCPEVKIDLNKTDDTLYAELDSSLFYNDTNWKPQYTMEDVVRRIFEYQISKKSC